MLRRLLLRRISPHRLPRAAAPGYAMPLAVGASGVLLLMSLTLHGMAMQERLQVGARERVQREEDLLASAAHQLLAALNASHPCLLALPLAEWEGATCATPMAVVALKEAVVMAAPVRVHGWQPASDGQSAQLALQLVAGPGWGARQGRYGVRLYGSPVLVAELGPRLLGGGQP